MMRHHQDHQGLHSTMALSLQLLLSCTFLVSLTDAGGLLRDARYAAGGMSEALSHTDSDTTLYSSDNYLKCTSDHHITPTSTAEVSDLIKLHTSANSRVKIRATRRGFHSSAGFVCAGARGSSKKAHHETERSGPESVTMLLHELNQVVSVDREKMRMTVGAGMTLLQLVTAMEAADMSAPAGSLSIYGNLTVGGVILASAHGSGRGVACSLGDLVTSVTWVNARGEIRTSEVESVEGRAIVGGLGLLGVATEFTLQLRPNSHTVVETRKRLDDANLAEEVMRVTAEETPHVIVFWRPDFGTYKIVLWREVEEGGVVPRFYPNGSIAFLTEIDSKISSAWGKLMRVWEEDEAEESDAADVLNKDICTLSEVFHDVSMFRDGDGTPLDHATIPTNRAMVSRDCSPSCFFHIHHTQTFTEDTEFTIKLSRLRSWIDDVKTIVKTDLNKKQANLKTKRCLPPGYFWLRFGKGNENLLSTSSGDEEVAFVQWTHLSSAWRPDSLSKQGSVNEALEQLTLCKYGGRPHWGKNHERVFRHPECDVRGNFPPGNFEELLRLQGVHDPGKVFEPELFAQLVEREGPVYGPLCSTHFWCYCREDVHCPVGHACKGDTSFPEYKVCRLLEKERSYHSEDVAEL